MVGTRGLVNYDDDDENDNDDDDDNNDYDDENNDNKYDADDVFFIHIVM